MFCIYYNKRKKVNLMSIKQDVNVLAKQILLNNSYISPTQKKEELNTLTNSLLNIFEYIKDGSLKAKKAGEIKLDNELKERIKKRYLEYLDIYEHDSLNTLPNKDKLAVKLVYFQIVCNTPHDKLIYCILQCGRDGIYNLEAKLEDVVNKYGYT